MSSSSCYDTAAVHLAAIFKLAATDLASQLFDGDASDDEAAAALAAARAAAGGSSSDVLQQQQQPKRGLREQDYNSEDDDFIEDDIGGMYNQRLALLQAAVVAAMGINVNTERRRERQHEGRHAVDMSGPTQTQLDDAKEIFGEGIIDFFREQRGDAADAMDIDAVDEDGNRLQQQQPKRRLKAAASATAGIEPAVLREHFLEKTDLDIQAKDKTCTRNSALYNAQSTLQATDRLALALSIPSLLLLLYHRPERLQFRMVGRGERTDAERGEEAKWILRELKLSHSVDEEAAVIAIEK
eukprot:7664-Heterococcus_DN1.PRE.1